MSEKKAIVSLITIGFSSMTAQLVLIREAISTFSGNELVIGIILGLWLIFTALGAYLGTRITRKGSSEKLLLTGHVFLAILPLMQITGFRALPLLWVRGELLGIGSVIIGSSLILIPYCLISGAMICLAASILLTRDAPAIVYMADLGGDILGGILFSFVFIYSLSHWGTCIGISLINLFVALMLSSPKLWLTPVLLAVMISLTFPFDFQTLSWRTPGQKILLHKTTPFAQLAITKTGRQLNIISDGLPLFSSQDFKAEALSHIPLSQVGQGADVLLIGGGVFGTLKEMLRHNPSRIDYVEIDSAIFEMDNQIHKTLKVPSIHTHAGDGRLFVKRAVSACLQYDCLVVDLPDPESIQLNRFYTREFFHEVKRILKPEGILFFTLAGASNYLEAEVLALNSSVYTALSQTFPEVIILPGETHYFMASRGPLSPGRISKELARRNIVTRWLVDYQLPEMLDPFRIDQVRSLVEKRGNAPNTDLAPQAFHHILNVWLTKSGGMRWLVSGVLILVSLLALLACSGNILRFTPLSSGYAGISLELTVIILFQIIFGYIYSWVSFFITLFMAGSMAGALAALRWEKSSLRQIFSLDIAQIFVAVIMFVLAAFNKQLQSNLSLFLVHYGILPLLTFSSAMAVGWQFAAMSRHLKGTTAAITGSLYLADLAGASCGTMFTTLLILPRWGIQGILFSVIAVKVINLATLSGKVTCHNS
ncbi:MAG: hypothetical protein ACMUIA_06190 [bacterium]